MSLTCPDPLLTSPDGTVARVAAGHEISGKGRRGGALLFRLCVVLLLFLLIFCWFDVSGVVDALKAIDMRLVLLASALLSLQFALSVVRWALVLRNQGVPVGLKRSLSIYGLGALANLFLVTSIAGLSVRGVLLVRAGTGVSVALASLVAERIAAVIGLGLAGTIGFMFAFPLISDHLPRINLGQGLDLFVLICIAAVAVFCAVTALRIAALRTFAASVASAFRSVPEFVLLALVSVGVVLLGFAGLATLANGMNLDIDPVFFISVMPVVSLASSLPISVGGWGVREGAMVAGLSFFAVPGEAAVALSISYGLAGLMVTAVLAGLLVLLETFASDAGDATANGPATLRRERPR